jgi:hypothetical protein
MIVVSDKPMVETGRRAVGEAEFDHVAAGAMGSYITGAPEIADVRHAVTISTLASG